jgi:GNAT superfamily N-acetyltransferase
MDGEYFIAWRDGQPVGTIAAFINHRHNERWNERIGWFGAFDFIDDPAVAAALLGAAEEYVRRQGYESIRGPATFSFHSEIGVLMDTYDRPPILLMPYNYHYYPKHIEATGYSKVKDIFDWWTDAQYQRSEHGLSHKFDKVERLAQRVMERRNITWRLGDKRNKKQDFAIMYELYNSAWQNNWGFVPLTEREKQELIEELSQIYEPDLAIYIFVDGDPAGFIVGVPDMNQAFLRAYPRPGEPELWTLLKVLWHWKIRPKINTLRFPLAGAKPEYRSAGIGIMMAYTYLKVYRETKWDEFVGGWVLEDNEALNEVIEGFRAKIGRRYRIYQKTLTAK